MASDGPPHSSDLRRRLGVAGELLARRHLEARGLRVLDANFRTRHGELDLVATDDRRLVFCEVKTRMVASSAAVDSGELGPFAAIGAQKRRKLRRMAREWLAQAEREGSWWPELRFDAIGIEVDRRGRLLRLDHLEGAF